jgi:hypothetical protein
VCPYLILHVYQNNDTLVLFILWLSAIQKYILISETHGEKRHIQIVNLYCYSKQSKSLIIYHKCMLLQVTNYWCLNGIADYNIDVSNCAVSNVGYPTERYLISPFETSAVLYLLPGLVYRAHTVYSLDCAWRDVPRESRAYCIHPVDGTSNSRPVSNSLLSAVYWKSVGLCSKL